MLQFQKDLQVLKNHSHESSKFCLSYWHPVKLNHSCWFRLLHSEMILNKTATAIYRQFLTTISHSTDMPPWLLQELHPLSSSSPWKQHVHSWVITLGMVTCHCKYLDVLFCKMGHDHVKLYSRILSLK